MRLTRRDAVAALVAAGIAAGGGVAVHRSRQGAASDDAFGDHELDILVAAAETLYPREVEGTRPFVEGFVRGRVSDSEEHRRGVLAAVEYLDDYALSWYETSFADLDRDSRDEALRRMDADVAAPDPDGSDVERVRYYVVNDLLFALFASPIGGELVGLENPQGHPGGIASYRRGPGP